MSRLFITPREVDFISDITKEFFKDVVGQKIYYFSVSEIKSAVHDVYLEAPEKIFENPLELDALIEFQPQNTRTTNFGHEATYDIKVWLHVRDLIDKGINVSVGDFFSYGDVFFEIASIKTTETVYGEIEHKVGYELFGKQSRQQQFVTKVFGPTAESYSDPDAVQETFVQQRGADTNRLGPTGDVRDLVKKGVLEPPLTGPKEISPRGSDTRAGSAFYDEE